jgi:hypothetical protein
MGLPFELGAVQVTATSVSPATAAGFTTAAGTDDVAAITFGGGHAGVPWVKTRLLVDV